MDQKLVIYHRNKGGTTRREMLAFNAEDPSQTPIICKEVLHLMQVFHKAGTEAFIILVNGVRVAEYGPADTLIISPGELIQPNQ